MNLLTYLDIQILKIKFSLNPQAPHAQGPVKPTLSQQEAKQPKR